MAIPTSPNGALAATRIAGYDASLADLSLSDRIDALISLSQRFGRILPVHSINPATGVCTCGGFVKYKGKVTDRPCHAGKHPNLWKWQVKASSDPKQLAKWANKFPGGNWGIVSGELTDVIDVDSKPTVDGMVSLRALEAEIGIDLMAIAVVVKTGNGIQLWFKHDPAGRLKTTAGIRPGIDIRGGHKGKGLGMVLAPGSKHPNGNTYQIVSMPENGLQKVPEALFLALCYQQSNNSYIHSVVGGGGGGETEAKVKIQVDVAQQFQITQDAELTAARRVDLEIFQSWLPKFKSTWSMTRDTSLWKFREGRNSPSEYEASIAFFLVWAGWSEQEIMDCIVVWRREHNLEAPVHYSRYAITIGKAVAMVTPRTSYVAAQKDPLKGAWKHGYTRNHILGSIIDTPRTTKQISEVTGIDHPHVKVVIGRLRKDGIVIRDNHTYLCAPHAVPCYLRNIPDDAGEPTSEEMEAEYDEWVAAGGLDVIEEEIEAPLLGSRTAPALIKATLPDFDEYVEPEPVTQPAEAPYIFTWPDAVEQVYVDGSDPFSSRAIAGYRAATAAWEVQYKQEGLENARKARARGNGSAQLKRHKAARKLANSYVRLPSQLDPNGDRLEELEAERARLRHLDDKEDPA